MNSLAGLRPVPLYFLGDSHALVHSDQLYRNELTGQLFVGRAMYVNGLRMRDLTSADGELAPPLLAMLENHLLIVPHDGGYIAFHRSNREHWRRVAVASHREFSEPNLILTSGALDAIGVLADRSGIESSIVGLSRAIRSLHDLGFARVLVPSLVPFTDDSDEFEYYFSIKTTRNQRRDITLAFNEAIRQACDSEGATFLDTWRRHTIDGAPLPDLLHDHAHLTPRYASAVAEAIFDSESSAKTNTIVGMR